MQWLLALLAGQVVLLCSNRVIGVNQQDRKRPEAKTFRDNPSFPDADVDDQLHCDMHDLLEKYVPILKLSPGERFFPSSVEYTLPHFDHVMDQDGSYLPAALRDVNPANLDKIPSSENGPSLSISDPHRPAPFFETNISDYLYGPAAESQPGREISGSNQTILREKIYGFWVERERGVVDLWYWTYYPFNLGKSIGPFGVFGWFGHHVSDWERMTVRTVNGTAISADYNVHAGSGSAGTVRWDDLPKIDGHPVAYVAEGSHGLWPSAGDNVYVNFLNVLKLVDKTADDGPIWDPRGKVVPLRWWHGPSNGSLIRHSGELSWANFWGHWGNWGDRKRVWDHIVDTREIVQGPIGPNREFRVPPNCIPSPHNVNYSSFSFYFSPGAVRNGTEWDITTVKVEQRCTAAVKAPTHVKSTKESNTPVSQDAGKGSLPNDLSGTTSFNGLEQHTVYLRPCSGHQTAISAYRPSFCFANSTCVAMMSWRSICAYKDGEGGYQPASAVVVVDLDNWLLEERGW